MGYEPIAGGEKPAPKVSYHSQRVPDSMRAEMRRVLAMPWSEFEDYYANIQEKLQSTDLLIEQGTIQL